jgi:uncharacterized protein
MPSQLTYPGVYVEEIPSGVRTIGGVATSICAFVGWAPKGGTQRPDLVLSFADYERKFGGLSHPDSLVSYAVYQFFLNGGQQAYVLRVVDAAALPGTATVGGIAFQASSQGTWSSDYKVQITAVKDRFRLEVQRFQEKGKPLAAPVAVEVFESLSVEPHDKRFVETVINEESSFVQIATGSIPAGAPNPSDGSASLADGKDGAVLVPGTPEFQAAVNLVFVSDASNPFARVDLFNLMAVPGESDTTLLQAVQTYCVKRRALLVADTPDNLSIDQAQKAPEGLAGDNARNGAMYFPWLKAADPLQENRLRTFPPSGFVAGIMARTDTSRGVWKAPAGIDASVTGAIGFKEPLTDDENGLLNAKGLNCLRQFPVYGTVVWGARTLQGDDQFGSEWKYVPVRRTALFIEESLFRGLKWVVFEPNDEPLWASIRLNVGAFMNDLFRQGAFQGRSPRDAYFVKCDKDTTIQSDINRGIVNIVVGFAPLKPAEFVVLKLQQMAGQIQV